MEYDVRPHEPYDVAISSIFIVVMLVVTVLIFALAYMDEEEHHVEVQREASAAGLLAVVFLMFLDLCCLDRWLHVLGLCAPPLRRYLRPVQVRARAVAAGEPHDQPPSCDRPSCRLSSPRMVRLGAVV